MAEIEHKLHRRDRMSEVLAMRDEYRIEQWANMVRQCRESGLSNREFCRLNNISEKTYYYRLRKLRKKAVEIGKTESTSAAACTSICKIDLTDELPCEAEPGRIRIQYHGAEIDVTREASPDTLKMILCILKEI